MCLGAQMGAGMALILYQLEYRPEGFYLVEL